MEHYRPKELLESSQSKFYADMDKKEADEQVPSDIEKAKQFWGNIWSNASEHNKDAEWLEKIRQGVQVSKQVCMLRYFYLQQSIEKTYF